MVSLGTLPLFLPVRHVNNSRAPSLTTLGLLSDIPDPAVITLPSIFQIRQNTPSLKPSDVVLGESFSIEFCSQDCFSFKPTENLFIHQLSSSSGRNFQQRFRSRKFVDSHFQLPLKSKTDSY
jgi:hypothetical protein